MSFGNTSKDGSGTPYWLLVDSDGRQIVAGAAAHDAAAAGNPVLVGGKYQASADTVDDGDAVEFLTDQYGRQIIVCGGFSGTSVAQLTADGDIKASAGTLYALTICFIGVTAGDTVVIKDGATEKIRFVATAANENIHVNYTVPISFATSITVDITKTGGNMYVTGVYA